VAIGECNVIVIETDRLAIRNFSVEDSEALHRMICQYEKSEYARYDHQWPTSIEEIMEVAAWFATGESYLAVCLRSTGEFIGFVSLNKESRDDLREYNLGYCFDFNYHSEGYASEACKAVINYAFDHMHADRIITGTAADNKPSCRLLERLGFKKTSEGMVSFRKTADGNPVEFIGHSYSLTRKAT
jgi:ribosomal-protein-alanine N-acetyltransferase